MNRETFFSKFRRLVKSNPVAVRLLSLVRLYVVMMLIFVVQKLLFILFNMSYADGISLGNVGLVVLNGLYLDSVMACYLLLPPTLAVGVSMFVKDAKMRRWLRPYYVVAAFLMAVVFVADVVMYGYWGTKIDAGDLMYLQHPKDMLASVSWLLIVVGVLVVALLTFHYARRLSMATPKEAAGRPGWPWSMTLIPIWGLLFIGVRGGCGTATANPSFAYFSSNPFCNHAALNPGFNMVHSLVKNEDLATQFQFYTEEELGLLTDEFYYDDPQIADTLLATQRPDILMIVWEGAGTLMVDNDSVAPGFMTMRREGVFFTQCIANGARTDRGLVSILSGWPALPNTSLMKVTGICNKLPGIAENLRREGYATEFVYGGDADFTNMRGYLYEVGFDNVRGGESFPKYRHLSDWGVPDEYLLRQPYGSQKTPRFTVMLTLSSHEPWQVPMERLSDKKRNAFAYSDSCIYALVRQLKASPEWDSLLVIIVPDHGIPASDGQSSADPEVARIPMLWTGGAVRQPAEVDRMMNQSDLAATLLAQMGIDASEFVLSRNVMSPSASHNRPFAIHSFRNGINYFDTTGVTSFDCVEQEEFLALPSHSSDRLRHARAALQHLYKTTGRL